MENTEKCFRQKLYDFEGNINTIGLTLSGVIKVRIRSLWIF